MKISELTNEDLISEASPLSVASIGSAIGKAAGAVKSAITPAPLAVKNAKQELITKLAYVYNRAKFVHNSDPEQAMISALSKKYARSHAGALLNDPKFVDSILKSARKLANKTRYRPLNTSSFSKFITEPILKTLGIFKKSAIYTFMIAVGLYELASILADAATNIFNIYQTANNYDENNPPAGYTGDGSPESLAEWADSAASRQVSVAMKKVTVVIGTYYTGKVSYLILAKLFGKLPKMAKVGDAISKLSPVAGLALLYGLHTNYDTQQKFAEAIVKGGIFGTIGDNVVSSIESIVSSVSTTSEPSVGTQPDSATIKSLSPKTTKPSTQQPALIQPKPFVDNPADWEPYGAPGDMLEKNKKTGKIRYR